MAETTAKPADLARWYYKQIEVAEQSRIDQQARLARIAWRVAAAAMVTALIAILGAAALVMIKRPAPPVVLRHDTVSGQVDVIDVARSGKVDFGQAADIADLRRYVEQRESYDWETVQSLYDSVNAKTCGAELGRYTALYATSEPKSPLKVWKNEIRVIARAGAVTFVGKTAQVFFERRFVSLAGASAPATDYQVATIAYEHRNDATRQSLIELNPTGFCVLSYTVARDWTRTEKSPTSEGGR